MVEEAAIREYVRLMEELGINVLELARDGKIKRIELSASPSRQILSGDGKRKSDQNTPDSIGSDGTYIRSPMVGVFYTSPTENAPPFVQVGKKIKKGDVLCIIEAMKLMNEITSEYDGVISEICVTNGQVVEYGSALFRIEGE